MHKAVFISILFPLFAFTQKSVVYDTLKIYSEKLGMERNFGIYLPAGYQSSVRSYPVLYLLHGGGVDHTGWIQQGEIQSIADREISNGNATAMIIIMPDAYTKRRGYYENKEDWLFEDFFFKELIPFVEKTYRIKAEKHFRAICGFSIGGKAAFTYAIRHPEIFAAACPLSAAAGFRENSVVALIGTIPDSLKNSIRWFIDCGDDDFLFEGNLQALQKAGIKNEFRVRDGGHEWNYWRTAMPAVLGFISAGFRDY